MHNFLNFLKNQKKMDGYLVVVHKIKQILISDFANPAVAVSAETAILKVDYSVSLYPEGESPVRF